jgi:hypothetical protein
MLAVLVGLAVLAALSAVSKMMEKDLPADARPYSSLSGRERRPMILYGFGCFLVLLHSSIAFGLLANGNLRASAGAAGTVVVFWVVSIAAYRAVLGHRRRPD